MIVWETSVKSKSTNEWFGMIDDLEEGFQGDAMKHTVKIGATLVLKVEIVVCSQWEDEKDCLIHGWYVSL